VTARSRHRDDPRHRVPDPFESACGSACSHPGVLDCSRHARGDLDAVAQYIVLIVAYLIPIFWMSIAQVSAGLPHSSTAPPSHASWNSSRSIGVGNRSDRDVEGLKALTTLHATRPGALAAWKFVNPRVLHDGRHRLAAAHTCNALLHDAFGGVDARPNSCGLVAVLHLPALLLCAALRDFSQSCR